MWRFRYGSSEENKWRYLPCLFRHSRQVQRFSTLVQTVAEMRSFILTKDMILQQRCYETIASLYYSTHIQRPSKLRTSKQVKSLNVQYYISYVQFFRGEVTIWTHKFSFLCLPITEQKKLCRDKKKVFFWGFGASIQLLFILNVVDIS